MLKKFEAKKKLVVKKNFRYKMGKTLGNQFLAKKNWGGGIFGGILSQNIGG